MDARPALIDTLPTFSDLLDAAARIRPHARVTPVLRSDALDAIAGTRLHFKCENLQRAGAFKMCIRDRNTAASDAGRHG